MGPRASLAWRGIRRLCGMYKLTLALCSWWVVHRRPVALPKLSIHTHHLSLFRVLWRLVFFLSSWIYTCSWKIARWTLNINQSISINFLLFFHYGKSSTWWRLLSGTCLAWQFFLFIFFFYNFYSFSFLQFFFFFFFFFLFSIRWKHVVDY
jgi:hypothetical protein